MCHLPIFKLLTNSCWNGKPFGIPLQHDIRAPHPIKVRANIHAKKGTIFLED